MVCQNCFEENVKSAEVCTSCGMRLGDELFIMPDVIAGKRTAYAGFWLRFAALIIDGIVMAFAGGLIGGLVGGILGAIMGASGVDLETIQLVTGIIGYILGTVMNWLYYALMESSSHQATLGKQAVGIIVTDEAGQQLSFWRATGRYFAKFISSITFFIGYIMAGFTDKKQALHDMIASTVVVEKRKY